MSVLRLSFSSSCMSACGEIRSMRCLKIEATEFTSIPSLPLLQITLSNNHLESALRSPVTTAFAPLFWAFNFDDQSLI